MARPSTSPSIHRMSSCVLILVFALQLGIAHATARLGQMSVITSNPSSNEPNIADQEQVAVQRIVRAATSSLKATYAAVETSDPTRFPDVVDSTTGLWHVDEINANGAAGLFAGCLWSLHKLTGDAMWRTRALATSAALRTSVEDVSMGQAIGTLTYPAIRYAYESEQDPAEKQAYLDAALQAATTLAKLYAKIPGVLKVRPTADIAAKAKQLGAPSVSPLSVFSSVEGAAAATGLLAWASSLPGGRSAWREMALSNAGKLVADHMNDDGSARGTLLYKATSALAEPKELFPQPSKPSTTSTLAALLESKWLVADSAADSAPADPSALLDSWISSVGGQASSPQLRQALATLALVEAVHAAADNSVEADALLSAAEAAAGLLIDVAVDPLTHEPAAAAAAAAALAELASLSASPALRAAYATTARHIVVTFASDRLSDSVSSPSSSLSATASTADDTLAAVAGRWVSGLLRANSLEQQSSSSSSTTTSTPITTTFVPASILVRSGSRSGSVSAADSQGGSMLADSMLLRALVSLAALSR